MIQPIILRWLPKHLRSIAYSRFFSKRHAHWLRLFDSAPLTYAVGIRMHGLIPGDIISGHIAFNGYYELQLTREITQIAARGGLLVDVGANMGYFSFLWAAASQDNRIIALEASPKVADILRNNIEINGLSDRITLFEKAALDCAGTVKFDVGPSSQTGWGGVAPDGSQGIEVEAVRLDALLKGQDIAVLKIDVEGADELVLRGCEELLRTGRIAVIFFEENALRKQDLGIKSDDINKWLADFGYNVRPFNRECTEWVATFPSADL
ncbi:MAG: FkbM family methyltransferase [Pseudomonadota bacterium]